MHYIILACILVGLLQGFNKIIDTREGKLPPAKEYKNILEYLLRE